MGGPAFNATVSGNGNPGVQGISANGNGVVGQSTNASGVAASSQTFDGIRGSTASDDRTTGGVTGSSRRGKGGSGVYGYVRGVFGPAGDYSPSTATAVVGDAEDGIGVDGLCDTGVAVRGRAIGRPNPVTGQHLPGIGVRGESTTLFGVWGESSGVAVMGSSDTGIGVRGTSFQQSNELNGGIGVHGVAANGATAVAGTCQAGSTAVLGIASGGGAAARFIGRVFILGDVRVTGILFANVKAFRIDHPLDPQNRYLTHAAVECPEMKTMYDGIAVLDDSGEATVTMPEWFEALNTDFRYQLTPIGAPATSLYIAKEVEHNEFAIGGGTPGMKVSWQVTGVRQDEWAKANPIPVEQEKQAEEGFRDIYTDPSQWMQKVSAWIEEERARTEELTERLMPTPSRHRPTPETGESLS